MQKIYDPAIKHLLNSFTVGIKPRPSEPFDIQRRSLVAADHMKYDNYTAGEHASSALLWPQL